MKMAKKRKGNWSCTEPGKESSTMETTNIGPCEMDKGEGTYTLVASLKE
jgi:hypothetical protein